MKKIILQGTNIETTSLGFGCASLMRLATSKGRQKVLNAAYDAGVRHFDVARMYGMGQAERELSKFTKAHRSDVTITSKFGIEVSERSRKLAPFINIARHLIRLIPSAKKIATNNASSLYQGRRYDAEMAKKCLEKSLSELKTDYLDLFMLHEPDMSHLENTDVLEFLEKSKEKGMIRSYGIAGYPEDCLDICKSSPELIKVLQIPNDVINHQLDQFSDIYHGSFITFSPFSNALSRIVNYVSSDQMIKKTWKEKTGFDCASASNVSKLLIRHSIDSNPDGVVLFSTTKSERIAGYVDALDDKYLVKDVMDSFSSLAIEKFS